MKYIITFPSQNTRIRGEHTMHYVEHRTDPWMLDSSWKRSDATLFDTVEKANAVKDIISEHSPLDFIITVMPR